MKFTVFDFNPAKLFVGLY